MGAEKPLNVVFENDDMRVHALVLGSLRTNCFVVEHKAFGFIVDPVGEPEVLDAYLSDNNISIRFCIATHGHYDHVGAAAHLIEKGRCGVLHIHPDDQVELRRCNTYSLLLDKKPTVLPSAENIVWFNEDTQALLDEIDFTFEHLPGHTLGSSIIFSKDRSMIFSGDILLMQNGDGNRRCKVGENIEGVKRSIVHIYDTFPSDATVFPGHGKVAPLETFAVHHQDVREALL